MKKNAQYPASAEILDRRIKIENWKTVARTRHLTVRQRGGTLSEGDREESGSQEFRMMQNTARGWNTGLSVSIQRPM